MNIPPTQDQSVKSSSHDKNINDVILQSHRKLQNPPSEKKPEFYQKELVKATPKPKPEPKPFVPVLKKEKSKKISKAVPLLLGVSERKIQKTDTIYQRKK